MATKFQFRLMGDSQNGIVCRIASGIPAEREHNGLVRHHRNIVRLPIFFSVPRCRSNSLIFPDIFLFAVESEMVGLATTLTRWMNWYDRSGSMMKKRLSSTCEIRSKAMASGSDRSHHMGLDLFLGDVMPVITELQSFFVDPLILIPSSVFLICVTLDTSFVKTEEFPFITYRLHRG